MTNGKLQKKLIRLVRISWELLTSPFAILLISYSFKVKSGYGMTYGKRVRLGFRFWRNYSKVQSGTSWRAHLVMAMKLLAHMPCCMTLLLRRLC